MGSSGLKPIELWAVKARQTGTSILLCSMSGIPEFYQRKQDAELACTRYRNSAKFIHFEVIHLVEQINEKV